MKNQLGFSRIVLSTDVDFELSEDRGENMPSIRLLRAFVRVLRLMQYTKEDIAEALRDVLSENLQYLRKQ